MRAVQVASTFAQAAEVFAKSCALDKANKDCRRWHAAPLVRSKRQALSGLRPTVTSSTN